MLDTDPMRDDTICLRIQFELGITASVGARFNKIFAKLGNDIKSPMQYRPFPMEIIEKSMRAAGKRATLC